ncbi:MAG: HPr(Ser) kinase/phosphatase [Ruminococcaceae bacterium]|nr:HPr(Ser) kinase/phosphatase [Oscillospiraceae bacterium]
MASVTLQAIINELKLNVLFSPVDPSNIRINRNKINRPALPLTGFFECFDSDRIQVVGTTEYRYLASLPDDVRKEHIRRLFERRPPALIYTHGNPIDNVVMDAAKEFEVPLLWTDGNTGEFTAALIAFLDLKLAPTITRHGVLVEVYGEGILIVGDSGVGKSETAIELIKRGHRLIADDAVELRRVSAKTIVGSAPELIRHYIELRGIGIIDVRRIFGMGAVKDTEKVNLVVEFEPWEAGKMYERLGIDENYTEIMGIRIPSLTVPIKPGRNLAVILEIAAMNNRQKRMGYNTAQEFNQKLMEQMEAQMAEMELEM